MVEEDGGELSMIEVNSSALSTCSQENPLTPTRRNRSFRLGALILPSSSVSKAQLLWRRKSYLPKASLASGTEEGGKILVAAQRGFSFLFLAPGTSRSELTSRH